MSRHEGVSCDSCLKANFRGRRYKCLICYDYDLCATCYEVGATTTRHTADHPMQCILTRTDFDLFYGGEAVSAEQPQSFSCPYCGKMGYMETSLQEHVTSEHSESSVEVVCPICAALPGGDPNFVTEDFAAHLTLEHRAPRDLDEPVGGIRHVRRAPHPARSVGGNRTRRTNMHFQSAGAGTLSGLSPSNREAMDPIAELLSQLSSVRSRAAATQSVSSQLQQLEMQLQSTRYLLPRQQLERLPRRQAMESSRSTANSGLAVGGPSVPGAAMDYAGALGGSHGQAGTAATSSTANANSQFLLARCGEPDLTELDKQALETAQADRSIFVQELLLSSLAEGLRLEDDDLLSNVIGLPALDDELDSVARRAAASAPASSGTTGSPAAAPATATATPSNAPPSGLAQPRAPSPSHSGRGANDVIHASSSTPSSASHDTSSVGLRPAPAPHGGGGGPAKGRVSGGGGAKEGGGGSQGLNSPAGPVGQRGAGVRRLDGEKDRESPPFKVVH